MSLWPYPPLYLAWLMVAAGLADVSGASFHGVVQLAPIAADVGIALAIYAYLGWRGATERLRLAGAALVLVGPVFIAISGYHGQFDSVAILPAVLALMAWERYRGDARGVSAGVLLGIGTAVKTVPALLVLALLPSARSGRQAALILAATVCVPALVVAPFYIAEPAAVREALGFQGQVAWRGGLSLVADPGHAVDVVGGGRAFFERPNAVAD